MWSERAREDRRAVRVLKGDDRELDNGGAIGVCGAACGPSV